MKTRLLGLKSLAVIVCTVALASVSAPGQSINLERLLRAYPMNEEALRANYDERALPQLKSFVTDTNWARYIDNVMLAIGWVGGDEATDYLVNHILRRFEGEVNETDRIGLFGALMGLGNQLAVGNARARDFLIRHHTMTSWRHAGLKWWHGRQNGDVLYRALADKALLSLVGINHPDIDDVFRRVEFDESPDYAELRRELRDLPEILKIHKWALAQRNKPRPKTSTMLQNPVQPMPKAAEIPKLLTRDEFSRGLPADVTALSASEAEQLVQEVMRKYEEISKLFVEQPLEVSAVRLADDGRSFLSTVTPRKPDVDAFIGQFVADGSLEKTRACHALLVNSDWSMRITKASQ